MFCRKDDNKISFNEIGQRLSSECEPYILPLFQPLKEEVIGKNVSWLCKALGSKDIDIQWRTPPASSGTSGSEQIAVTPALSNGQCSTDGRHCVLDGALSIQFLHPTDSGRHSCVAKSKYGKDQMNVQLNVKVSNIKQKYTQYIRVVHQ